MRLNNYTTLYNDFIFNKRLSVSWSCFSYTVPTDFEQYAGKEYEWFQWDRWRPSVSTCCRKRPDELRDIDDALAGLDSSFLNPTNYSQETIDQLTI
mgnify:CR=1 FL=1